MGRSGEQRSRMLWLGYFSITLTLEVVGLLFLNTYLKTSSKKVFFACLIANLLSHPLLFQATKDASFLVLAIGEGLVILFETLIYKTIGKLNLLEALGVSFVLNGLSWGVGRIVLTFF
jgi:hypothetical protein